MKRSIYLRIAIGLISVLVAASFFLFIDLGGTVSGALNPWSLVFIALWVSPFYLFLRHVQGSKTTLFGGAALLAGEVWGLVEMFRSGHSTSSIASVVVPGLILIPAALVFLAIDGSISNLSPRRGRHGGEV